MTFISHCKTISINLNNAHCETAPQAYCLRCCFFRAMVKTLYLRRKELAESGKKLRSTDENYLNLAENMLFEEFAYALDIDRSEVVKYIEDHIT